eukprot:588377-Pelagomonas_calceolata.AAC.6
MAKHICWRKGELMAKCIMTKAELVMALGWYKIFCVPSCNSFVDKGVPMGWISASLASHAGFLFLGRAAGEPRCASFAS